MGETPGQKISYQIGKLQIMQMLSEAQASKVRNSACAISTITCGRTEIYHRAAEVGVSGDG